MIVVCNISAAAVVSCNAYIPHPHRNYHSHHHSNRRRHHHYRHSHHPGIHPRHKLFFSFCLLSGQENYHGIILIARNSKLNFNKLSANAFNGLYTNLLPPITLG